MGFLADEALGIEGEGAAAIGVEGGEVAEGQAGEGEAGLEGGVAGSIGGGITVRDTRGLILAEGIAEVPEALPEVGGRLGREGQQAEEGAGGHSVAGAVLGVGVGQDRLDTGGRGRDDGTRRLGWF